jgi:hypothetical protein
MKPGMTVQHEIAKEILPELQKKYALFLRPEITSVRILHKDDKCYLEATVPKDVGESGDKTVESIDLSVIAPPAFDPRATVEENAAKFLELGPHSIFYHTDLFTAEACTLIPLAHGEPLPETPATENEGKRLKTINLKLKDLCRFYLDLDKEKEAPVGETYSYSYKALLDGAKEAGLNLDEFLTASIGYSLSEKKPRSKVLIFYAPFNQQIWLAICSKRNLSLDSLARIPGYSEQGQNFLPPKASPFVYYDGKEIYRIHRIGEKPRSWVYYSIDFGTFSGLFYSATNRAKYEMIRDNLLGHLEYSVVPTESRQVLTWQGKKIVINHAFCTLD